MNKNKKLEIRISQELYDNLKQVAKINNKTMSEYVRDMVTEDIAYQFSIEGIDSNLKEHQDKKKELENIVKEKIKELEQELKQFNQVLKH